MTATEQNRQYGKTKQTTPARMPERASYDVESVHAVLDEALVCHVAYIVDERPVMIPTLHVRVGDHIYLHGSTGSRMMLKASAGPLPICVTVTLMDGLVLARSWFNHSVNSRSVIIHGDATVVTDKDEKWDAMVALMEHIAVGRAEGSREANKREFAATAILRIPLESCSLKVRSGPPKDDEEDLVLAHWAGVLPTSTHFDELKSACDVPVPDYLKDYAR